MSKKQLVEQAGAMTLQEQMAYFQLQTQTGEPEWQELNLHEEFLEPKVMGMIQESIYVEELQELSWYRLALE